MSWPSLTAGVSGPAIIPCPRRRHQKNRDTAQELLGRLRDNWELQRFLQDGQEVSAGHQEGWDGVGMGMRTG